MTFVADARNEPPFLGVIPSQTTTVGTGITFQLTSTDLEGHAVTYTVIGATNSSGQAVTVQSSIDQATGRVTVTPPVGFTGPLNVRVGVKDSSGTNDTAVVTVTVGGNIDLDTASDTGVLNDDNVTGSNTPTLTIFAPAGQTVNITVNGTAAGTATPTGTAGQYKITLAAGLLRVGANTIAGTAGSTTLSPFTLTYAPSLRNLYVVPGAVGTPQQVIFTYTSAQSAFQSEYGYFKVDNANGAIGGLLPGAPGYFAAAMARRQIAFARGAAVQATTTINANGGEFLVMYIVQGNTSANLMTANPTNARTGSTVAFFSLTGANPDQFAHVSSADEALASQAIYGWEDLTGGGDRDYNDVVISVRASGSTPLSTLQVPGAANRTVSVTAESQGLEEESISRSRHDRARRDRVFLRRQRRRRNRDADPRLGGLRGRSARSQPRTCALRSGRGGEQHDNREPPWAGNSSSSTTFQTGPRRRSWRAMRPTASPAIRSRSSRPSRPTPTARFTRAASSPNA